MLGLNVGNSVNDFERSEKKLRDIIRTLEIVRKSNLSF